MKKIKVPIVTCLLLLLAGNSFSQDDKPPPYGIKYEQREVHKRLAGCDSTTGACPEFNLNYVWMTEGKNKEAFNNWAEKVLLNDIYKIEGQSYNSVEDMGDAFIADYVSFRKDYPEAPDVGWYLYATYENLNELSQVVSFSLSSESYTGGAHPNYYLTYFNYDYTTGEPVTLRQILIPGFEKELNKLIDKAFREKHDIKPNEPLTDAGLFEDKIEFSDNFLLTKNGIIFHYNIYEIWPYVYGATDVLIPYSDLIGLIDENGLGIY
jgi:hypothetical protein